MAVTSSTELSRRARTMTREAGKLNARLRRQRRLQQGPEPDPAPTTVDESAIATPATVPNKG